ncbi:MAG: PKD domain-containing protein [bacterium]
MHPATLQQQLPPLDSLARSSSETSGAELNGAEYSALLPSQHAAINGDNCVLTASGATGGGIAFAIYSFSLPDYTGAPELVLQCSSVVNGLYVGFSDYGSGRWKVVQADSAATQNIPFGNPSGMFAADGGFLVAVLVAEDAVATVERLAIGTPPAGNAPPVAVLNVDNAFGEAPFTVSYDAGSSSDPDGSITLFELDLDDDGTYEISEATAPAGSFDVTEEGSYPVRLRVTDDGGASSMALVVVTAGSGWQDSGAAINTDTYVAGRVDFHADGAPLIVHTGNDFGLSYTRALDGTGNSWPAGPSAIDSNGFLRNLFIAKLLGRPCVAYLMDIDEGPTEDFELRFVLAQNAAGTAWGTPAVLPETELMQAVVGLAVVDGNPAVLFQQFVHSESKNYLYYVRANDNQGDTWGSPVKVSELDVTIEEQSNLMVFGGVPCVAFAHSPLGSPDTQLRLARAADPQGSSWQADELVIQTDLFDACPPAMAELDGKLAIAYLDFSNVYVIRSTDGTASSWDSPQLIANTAFSFSLAFHDSFGHPALSWSSLTPHTIAEAKYIRALDSSGSSWPASESVITSSTDNVSSFSYSMVEAGTLNGLPAAFTSRLSDPLKLSVLK